VGALSDERSGLSFVIVIKSVVSMYIHIEKENVQELKMFIYNMYKASVSPGSVQQIMPYY
jgi:hypothetical protein